jgi:oxygen-independent coproporphyrinogen III oxidase
MTGTPNDWSQVLNDLARFDRPGPRYTSYPTAVEFHEGVASEQYEDALSLANAERSGQPLSFYSHLPFCEHRCLFCGCNVVITPHMPVAKKYLDYLLREIDMVAERLPNRGEIVQMHWGGGTPTYYSPEDLAALFGKIREHFDFPEGAEIALEVDPRVTDEEQLAMLAELGFNRLSLGVQDLTPEVQAAITRNQTFEQTQRLMEDARKHGFSEGINVDLIYGLPRQELASFGESIEQVISLRPDRVALYSFAYVPWIKGHQKKLDPALLPSPDLKVQLYLEGMRRFLDAGYVPIGMDHFALPDDELARAAKVGKLHRNFMGYSVMPAPDMVATGISGIGEVGHGFYQNRKKLSTYYEDLDAGRLPVVRGYALDEDDRIRQHVIRELMCNFRVDRAEVEETFSIDFGAYFGEELEALRPLEDAGFVGLSDADVRVTEAGRLFVRNACMEFDRYLKGPKSESPVFSRTV